MSLALIVRVHNSMFFFLLAKDTEKSGQTYGTTNLSVIRRDLYKSEAWSWSRVTTYASRKTSLQEKQIYDTRSEITTGSGTDKLYFWLHKTMHDQSH